MLCIACAQQQGPVEDELAEAPRYDLRAVTGEETSQTEPVQQPINETIYDELYDQALARNISINDSLIDSYIAMTLQDPKLVQQLDALGINPEEYSQRIRRAYIISEFLREQLQLDTIYATQDDVDDYLEQHQADFAEILAETDEQTEKLLRTSIQQKLTQKMQDDAVTSYIEALGEKLEVK
jgi:hypothetical protein